MAEVNSGQLTGKSSKKALSLKGQSSRFVLGALLLAQVQLEPKFQPGPTRIPQQIPIVAPEQSNPEDETLEGTSAESTDVKLTKKARQVKT